MKKVLVLAGLLLVGSIVLVSAEQAIVFVQPSTTGPVAWPLDGSNNPKVNCVNCGGGGGTTSNVVVTDPLVPLNQQTVNADGTALVNLQDVAGAAVKTGNGTASGSVRVALPTDGTGVVGLIAGTNVIGAVNTVTTNNSNVLPHICGSHVFKHITTNTDTQIVAASGSTTIYVCDYSFSFGGTGNAYLEKATSGTCATLTQLTGTWYGVANVAKTDANPFYRGLNTGASAQLCVNTSAAVSFDIDVYYDQY